MNYLYDGTLSFKHNATIQMTSPSPPNTYTIFKSYEQMVYHCHYYDELDNLLIYSHKVKHFHGDCSITYYKNIIDSSIITRFKINNEMQIIDNIDYDYRMANINMFFFKNHYNNVMAIGGYSLKGDIIKALLDYKVVDPVIYDIRKNLVYPELSFDCTLNKLVSCPFYGNGLHLFHYDLLTDSFIVSSNLPFGALPILSGYEQGRFDGGYSGLKRWDNIYKLTDTYGGISVYNSMASVLYDPYNQEYILYHRCNMSKGRRNLQFTKSTDLINWSDYELFVVGTNGFNWFDNCFYMPNFFKLNNICDFIGIISHTTVSNFESAEHGKYILVYSFDNLIWHYIGDVYDYTLHEETIVAGEPKIVNDNCNFYFILNKQEEQKMLLIQLQYNRLSYITQSNLNEDCIIITNLINPIDYDNHSNKFYINATVDSIDGYIKYALVDNNNNSISTYTIENCISITNIDNIKIELRWKDNEVSNDIKNIKIMFILKNAKLYGLYGLFVRI